MKFILILNLNLFLIFLIFIPVTTSTSTTTTTNTNLNKNNKFDFQGNPDNSLEEDLITNDQDNQDNQDDPDNPDKTLERIRDYMWDIAIKTDRRTNLAKKRLEIGILPDEYPSIMKNKALRVRTDLNMWEKVMLYPTAVWRMCIFPNFKINYVSWCNQNLALTKTKIKLNGCLNNFCLVCCDHLQLHYKEIASSNDIGDKFLLSSNLGFNNIKYIVSDEEINQCRSACKRQYKVDMPYILPTPPRDPSLGLTISNPAASCMDIKKWGNEDAKSGEFWIEILAKGKQKVYCDMETEGGGWTLFYNYKHSPGQELVLDSSKLPKSLEENSHMHLVNAGFNDQDIKEIRFLCTEKYKGEKFYWHFKTKNMSFIKVALNGEQEPFRSNSLIDSYIELPPPSWMNGIYKKRIFNSMIENLNNFGNNKDGGFAYTPFGASKYKAYWTIRGPSLKNPKYECATSHNYVGGYASPDSSPNMVETQHMIWFRGIAPDEETVQRRLLNRIRNDAS